MAKIIVAPYSTRLRTGNPNPKNPPSYWWEAVLAKLQGHEIIQIGIVGEDRLRGVSQHLTNWPLKALRGVLESADCFISVDSFLPHFVFAEKLNIRGVVIWGQSDPAIWGHDANINLLKSRDFLRPLQYQDWWTSVIYNPDVFVNPEVVVDACQAILASPRSTDRTQPVSHSIQLAQQSTVTTPT